jgi:AcrR family transcriptional regulator
MPRLNPNDRRPQLLAAALKATQDRGGNYALVTRRDIARLVGVSLGLVSHYLGTTEEIHARILEHAISEGAAEVLVFGLLAGHPVAHGAPEQLKQAAARLIRGQ